MQYARGLKLQEALVKQRHAGEISDTLLVLQHAPVITVGKRSTTHNILAVPEELNRRGVEVHHTERGGDVTWHGPGQIVLYPIVDVRGLGIGARRYVEGLEDVMISAAAKYGIRAQGRMEGETGVWVGKRKIGAVGVRISKGISSHGLAFNVNPDLSYFDLIVPCGIGDKDVTSMEKELGNSPSNDEVAQALAAAYTATFDCSLVEVNNEK